MGCRFADSDEAAAVVDKFFYGSDDCFVYPVLAAALCSVCVAYVDHNIKVFQQIFIFQDIIKTDERNIKRCAAQSLDDPEIRIILFVINCVMYHVVTPGAHFTPAVQDRYTLHTVRGHTLDVIIECTEFLAYLFDILYKIREFQSKFQVSAVTDPLDRASKDRTSCCYPVYFGFFDRIAALMEGIREKVRKETSLCIFYILDIAEQT